MHRSTDTTVRGRSHRVRRLAATLTALALIAAACSSDDGTDEAADTAPPATDSGDEPAETAAEPATTEPVDEPAEPDGDTADSADDESGDAGDADANGDAGDADGDGSEGDGSSDTDSEGSGATDGVLTVGATDVFPDLGPPTGETMKVALVNTEGTPGLDFPDVRLLVGASFDYLNEHGGLGGRPVDFITCTANGSPETSQACAQEVTGQDVELVLLGRDLFPDYPTYTAAGVPVIGMLPILPADYAADALFLTGGNATTMGAIAAAATEHYGAQSIGIIGADNAGANASEAQLTAALDIAGSEHTTIKGGDTETDAGFQGLMREAASGDPDLLVSLYADAGCIGTIRGRAALGIEIPVITTSICADSSVIEAVGDEALGWVFVGIQTDEDTPEREILQDIVVPALEIDPSEFDPNALGLGGLGTVMIMSLAVYANDVVAGGGEVTGSSLYEYFQTAAGLAQWPSGAAVECGQSDTYPSICAFTFPFAEYVEGGGVITVPGLEAVSSIDYLP